MPGCDFDHVTTTGTKKACMDCIFTIAKKSLSLAGTRTSPSQMEKTVPDKFNDARQSVVRLNAKTSSEPISQERMNRPQVLQEELHSSKEMEVQPSQEADSLIHASSGDSGKQDSASVDSVITRFVSYEEKILSEIQKEKQTLEELNLHMDKYLPISLDMVNMQESSEEDEDCFKENSSRDKGSSLGSLPSNLQAHKNTVENIRGIKNNIRKLLYQLYEVIELTYQCKQDSEDGQNYHKALLEMWIKWSKNQSEKVDGDTQLLEALILDMSRSIALKLESAFMDLMPKVQGLPSSLQDNLQQACYDMQELHSTFSMSGGFQDLDKHHLTQSQFKLTQAQGSVEKLFCFVENSVPSGWIVGPLSPFEYPFSEGITLLKENNILNCDMEAGKEVLC